MQIKGRVTSSRTQIPISFVSVLLSKNDSLISATLTDTIGTYSIVTKENKMGDTLSLSFSYSGKSSYKTRIVVNNSLLIVNSELADSTSLLDEVVVKSRKNVLIHKEDRFVFIPGLSLTTGNTVFDVLQHTPLVKAADDALSILIKGNAAIYLNNQPLRIPVNSLIAILKSTPAKEIKTIEVITNPGSQYEAGSNGGVINIVLKRNIEDGWQASISATDKQAYYNRQSANANISYHKNKLGVNANLGAWNTPQLKMENGNILLSTGLTISNRSRIYRLDKGYSINLNIEDAISSKQSLNIVSNIGIQRPGYNMTNYSTYSHNSNIDSTQKSTSEDLNDKVRNYFVNANYRYAIDSTGKYLNISGDYLNYLNQQNLYGNIYLVSKTTSESLINRNQYYSALPQKIQSYSAKIDFYYPVNAKNKITTGLFYTYTKSSNNYFYGNKEVEMYVNDTTKTNDFIYDENITAGYLNYNRTFSQKFDATLGVRIENTDNSGVQSTTSTVFRNNYTNLFPYISVNYVPNQDHQFSYSLTTHIKRPAFWELNPFRYYENSNLYVANNPFLQSPRSIHQEVSFVYQGKYIFISQFEYKHNAYSQFFQPDTTTPGTTKISRLNYGNTQHYIVGFITNQVFFKGLWTCNISVIGGYITSQLNVSSVVSGNVNSFFGNFILDNTINVSNKKRIYGFVKFDATLGGADANITVKSVSSLQTGIKKIHKSLTVSLFADNIYLGDKLRYKMTGNSNTYAIGNGLNIPDSRSVYLTLSYNFGNKNLHKTENKGAANPDIKNRLK